MVMGELTIIRYYELLHQIDFGPMISKDYIGIKLTNSPFHMVYVYKNFVAIIWFNVYLAHHSIL